MKLENHLLVVFTLILFALLLFACGTVANSPILNMTPIPSGWSDYRIPHYGVKFSYPTVFEKGFQDGLEGDYFCGITVHEDPKDVQYSMTVGIININIIETDNKLEDFTNSVVSAMSEDWNIEISESYTKKDLYAFQIHFANRTLPRSGVRTYLANDGFLLDIEFYDVPFLDCESDEIGYSNFWVYDQILNSIEFEKNP